MAYVDIYASLVTTGAAWTDPNSAAGAPSAGEAAPFATFTDTGAAALTATFPATIISGIITGFDAFLVIRTNSVQRSLVFSRTGLTFISAADFSNATFATLSDSATFNAATLKTDVQAGLTGLVAIVEAGLAATVDAKGFRMRITYTPTGPIDGGDEDTTYRICRTLVSGIVLP